MKLIFLLRIAVDTHSVMYKSCFTCRHYYIDPIDEWVNCEIGAANVKEIHCVECDKYGYFRKWKNLCK